MSGHCANSIKRVRTGSVTLIHNTFTNVMSLYRDFLRKTSKEAEYNYKINENIQELSETANNKKIKHKCDCIKTSQIRLRVIIKKQILSC